MPEGLSPVKIITALFVYCINAVATGRGGVLTYQGHGVAQPVAVVE